MRIRFITISVLAMLCGSPLARASEAPTYYLALGDSLAQGVQWSPTGDVLTNHGYADDLYALLRFRISGLQLAKLGCPGETTSSMITTGPCTSEYETTFGVANQLAAAETFLAKNKVALITLDIGANDIDKCVSLAGVDFSCASGIAPGVTTNLTTVLEALRAAAPDTPIIAMNSRSVLGRLDASSSGRAIIRSTVPSRSRRLQHLAGIDLWRRWCAGGGCGASFPDQ